MELTYTTRRSRLYVILNIAILWTCAHGLSRRGRPDANSGRPNESKIPEITIQHGRRDARGRSLSVAYRQAMLPVDLKEKLNMPSAMEGDQIDEENPTERTSIKSIRLEVQLMPDEAMMAFDLKEHPERPGEYSGFRNPQSRPLDESTYGEMNLITHENGDVSG